MASNTVPSVPSTDPGQARPTWRKRLISDVEIKPNGTFKVGLSTSTSRLPNAVRRRITGCARDRASGPA